MKKQDALDKISVLFEAVDKLPEDAAIIKATANTHHEKAEIQLYEPNERRIADTFGAAIVEEPFGEDTMNRSICWSGVKIFWLVDQEAHHAEEA